MIPHILHLIIELVLGIGIGYVLYWMTHETKPAGTLKIDTSDPNTDRYLMEFSIPLEEIPKKKNVLMKVDPNASIPSVSKKS